MMKANKKQADDGETWEILLVLNDQGGGVMNWNYEEKVSTLRSEMKHHEPIVLLGVKDGSERGENSEMSYQKVTGSLMASGYNKLGTQEAMNDMYVTQRNWDGSQVSPTLTSNNANGGQRMPDKENFNCIISETEEGGDEMKDVSTVVRRLTPL